MKVRGYIVLAAVACAVTVPGASWAAWTETIDDPDALYNVVDDVYYLIEKAEISSHADLSTIPGVVMGWVLNSGFIEHQNHPCDWDLDGNIDGLVMLKSSAICSIGNTTPIGSSIQSLTVTTTDQDNRLYVGDIDNDGKLEAVNVASKVCITEISSTGGLSNQIQWTIGSSVNSEWPFNVMKVGNVWYIITCTADGIEKWSIDGVRVAHYPVNMGWCHNLQITMSNSVVVSGNSVSGCLCLDADLGFKWSHPTAGHSDYIRDFEGRIYVQPKGCGGGGAALCLDEATGAVLGSHPQWSHDQQGALAWLSSTDRHTYPDFVCAPRSTLGWGWADALMNARSGDGWAATVHCPGHINAADFDGDGHDEIFTVPGGANDGKPGCEIRDRNETLRAVYSVGNVSSNVWSEAGDHNISQIPQWFGDPGDRLDVNRNGREEMYCELNGVVLLIESAGSTNTPPPAEIRDITLVEDTVTLSIGNLATNAVHTLERCFDLRSNDWTAVEVLDVGETETKWSETIDPACTKAFYRISSE
jgi:hypothetical protein